MNALDIIQQRKFTALIRFKERSDLKEVIVIPDRKEAIREAIKTGRRGDIIVVAGKGHETYQIIGDEIKHFDDREEILSLGRKRE